MNRKIIKQTALTIIIAYPALVLYALLVRNSLMFIPPKPSYHDTQEIIKLTTEDGTRISALYLKSQKAKYTLLYSHGNAADIGTLNNYLQWLRSLGFSIFTYDYQGYGTSEGHPSPGNCIEDVNAAYEYLIHTLKVPPDRIISMGQSLGAAIALDLATRKPVAGVILESPFLSAYRVYTQIPILLFDVFNNLPKIKKLHSPVLIIHGTADKMVWFWQAEKIFGAANEPKQHLWVQGANHFNVVFIAREKYVVALHQFLKLIETKQSSSSGKKNDGNIE